MPSVVFPNKMAVDVMVVKQADYNQRLPHSGMLEGVPVELLQMERIAESFPSHKDLSDTPRDFEVWLDHAVFLSRAKPLGPGSATCECEKRSPPDVTQALYAAGWLRGG